LSGFYGPEFPVHFPEKREINKSQYKGDDRHKENGEFHYGHFFKKGPFFHFCLPRGEPVRHHSKYTLFRKIRKGQEDMGGLSLSVVVITKNEEKKIRRCLDSVRGLAGEIVVVDDESTDNTPAIACEEYGAKVIVNRSRLNFDNQRNIGIGAASGEWVLQMDADEEVPPETHGAIKKAIEQGEGYAAFRLIRRDCVFGVPLRNSVQGKAAKLFRRDKARYVGSKVHETLEVDGKTGDIEADVLHYNFDSISEVIARWNLYTDTESAAYLDALPSEKRGFLKKRLVPRSVKLFYKHYIKHRGYKDGVYGLIWSVLHVIYPLLFWLKVFEKAIKENKLR
jgi:glycosyltransferase involved in cell wall biosynthesis